MIWHLEVPSKFRWDILSLTRQGCKEESFKVISPFRVLCPLCRTACPPPREAEDWNPSSAPASAPSGSTVLQTDLPSGNTKAVAASTRNCGQALPYTDAFARCARRCMEVWAERRSRIHLRVLFSFSSLGPALVLLSLLELTPLANCTHHFTCSFYFGGSHVPEPPPKAFCLN